MVKSHHVTNHIYTDFHIINFTIVISQSPNTSLIIIMNTPVENAKPAGQSSSFLDICILIPTLFSLDYFTKYCISLVFAPMFMMLVFPHLTSIQ